jgi:hypothetical protein
LTFCRSRNWASLIDYVMVKLKLWGSGIKSSFKGCFLLDDGRDIRTIGFCREKPNGMQACG